MPKHTAPQPTLPDIPGDPDHDGDTTPEPEPVFISAGLAADVRVYGSAEDPFSHRVITEDDLPPEAV